jgi:hypothetical protein
MCKFIFFILGFLFLNNSVAQTNPAITSWLQNPNGITGYEGIPINVQQVQYSNTFVYISCTDIPGWLPLTSTDGVSAGPNDYWPNNPWEPLNKNYLFKIRLNPIQNTGTPTVAPYGHIGIFTNGMSLYNPLDAKSWQEEDQWFQNAWYFEHIDLQTFDVCLGHPNGNFEYHSHVSPKCHWDETNSTVHAPLIGFAFDGFPIYGCYSYTNPNGTGPIKRLKSSYRLRTMTDRTTLPNGTVLPSNLVGPPLSTYPLGAYAEDFEYVPGLGDLDQHNGRFSVTPEYPNGIYCYFATLDDNLTPAYPYLIGPTFYGVVTPSNMGPNGGLNPNITEPVTVYLSINQVDNELVFICYPNPATDTINFYLPASFNSNMTLTIFDMTGKKVKEVANIQSAVSYSIDVSGLQAGQYTAVLENGNVKTTEKIIIK